MDYGRRPRRQIGHHDHEARQAHWTWLLSAPLPSDIERFDRHNAGGKHKDKKKEAVAQQRNNDEMKALPHRQHTSGSQMALTGPLTELMQFAREDREKPILIIGALTVNMIRDFGGSASVSQVLPQV